MKAAFLLLLLAGTLRAAGPEVFTGGPADLDKAVDARAAKLGKVAPADVPLARLPRKGALLRVAFVDLLPISHDGRGTAFIGHHALAAGSDFALVTFPDDVEISTRAAAVVIGSYAGSKEIAAASGAKTRVTVLAARVVGLLEDGTFRVYETPAKKKSPRKTGS